MPPVITVLPLGTASAIPSSTRNHSSLAIILPSSDTLLFDVGEGTQHQIHKYRTIKAEKISKIFITHLHGDHLFGLCPLLSSICNGAGGMANEKDDPRLTCAGEGESRPDEADIELYGPKGLREYVRSTLRLTYTHLDSWISIHELLFPQEEDTPNSIGSCYEKEIPGKNFRQDKDGFWRNIFANGEFNVSAGHIKHSIPAIGYVLTEAPLPGKIPKEYSHALSSHKEYFRSQGLPNPMVLLSVLQGTSTRTFPQNIVSEKGIHLPDGSTLMKPPSRPGRKITILGDTYDPSPIAPLAQYSTVLIHEATNAYLPSIDPNTKPTETYETVKERAMSHGHSTPEMAGLFARRINLGEQQMGESEGILILNHFSSRYKDDEADGPDGEAMKIMQAVKKCAETAWWEGVEGSGLMETSTGTISNRKKVVCARDGVKMEVKAMFLL
ncbi:beta-lactamase-like protein [Kalaharituber pfeilii]|nr:beta-lactamase-like protein [Kalaharituber pfeilii]